MKLTFWAYFKWHVYVGSLSFIWFLLSSFNHIIFLYGIFLVLILIFNFLQQYFCGLCELPYINPCQWSVIMFYFIFVMEYDSSYCRHKFWSVLEFSFCCMVTVLKFSSLMLQSHYVLLLCSFKEQLQQHVRVHAMEAVMACWEIEQSLQSLTGTVIYSFSIDCYILT